MNIDVVFDTVCPWCFIGKRRLEAALALRPDTKAQFRWRPFMLNPDMPLAGMDRQTYLVGKFGNEARIGRVYGAIVEAGRDEDIPFAFDRIVRTPNSLDSHRLIMFAEPAGRAGDAVDAVFKAYFLDGRDIGKKDVLMEIGADLGLDLGSLGRYLDGVDDIDRIRADNAAFHRMGINGVPAYIFNGSFVVSGAQEPAILARAMDAATAVATV